MSKVKAPYFPFYVDDFLASPAVNLMTAEQVGMYVMLLFRSWQSGGDLPNDPNVLWKLAGASSRRRFESINGDILAQFREKNGRIFHSRVRSEWEGYMARSARGKENADKRWRMEEISNSPITQQDGGDTECQLSMLDGCQSDASQHDPSNATGDAKTMLPSQAKPSKSNTGGFVNEEFEKAVDGIWKHYISVMEKNPNLYSFTTKRKTMCRTRLQDCLQKCNGDEIQALNMMLDCIDTMHASDWHMARGKFKDKGKRNDWHLLFRDIDRLEFWLNEMTKRSNAQ